MRALASFARNASLATRARVGANNAYAQALLEASVIITKAIKFSRRDSWSITGILLTKDSQVTKEKTYKVVTSII